MKLQIKLLTSTDLCWNDVAVYAEQCSWSAGKYMAEYMRRNPLTDWERVVVAYDQDQIAGYCTVAKKDCIEDVPYTPYIGFLFVGEEYRGNRLSEKMILFAEDYLKACGFDKVYLVSDHENLYEKYGFQVIDRKMAPWGSIEKIYVRDLGVGINDEKLVKEQYRSSGNLSTRISIHSKYSTNKTGFGNWICSYYLIKPGARVLELGCGTGDMWKEQLKLLQGAGEVVLSDFSDGMLKKARETLAHASGINYKVIDIQDIPYDDNYFDVVIANMMLYHVPDLDRGLQEVKRVLAPKGSFYCATYGVNGITGYVTALLKDYGVEDHISRTFTIQNGMDILKKYFTSVNRKDYEDSLEVTNIDDMVDYIYSLSGMTNMTSVSRETLKQILMNQTVSGILHVPKEYGMFICQ